MWKFIRIIHRHLQLFSAVEGQIYAILPVLIFLRNNEQFDTRVILKLFMHYMNSVLLNQFSENHCLLYKLHILKLCAMVFKDCMNRRLDVNWYV